MSTKKIKAKPTEEYYDTAEITEEYYKMILQAIQKYQADKSPDLLEKAVEVVDLFFSELNQKRIQDRYYNETRREQCPFEDEVLGALDSTTVTSIRVQCPFEDEVLGAVRDSIKRAIEKFEIRKSDHGISSLEAYFNKYIHNAIDWKIMDCLNKRINVPSSKTNAYTLEDLCEELGLAGEEKSILLPDYKSPLNSYGRRRALNKILEYNQTNMTIIVSSINPYAKRTEILDLAKLFDLEKTSDCQESVTV